MSMEKQKERERGEAAGKREKRVEGNSRHIRTLRI